MARIRRTQRRLLMLALALLALAVVQLASPAPSRAAEVTVGGGIELIDDMDPRFSFSAGDANNGGWGFGGSGSPAATEHWANKPAGATLDVSFKGTGIELFGKKASNHGMLKWWLDDAAEPADTDDAHVVDLYAEAAAPSSLLVRATGLTRGDHVLHVKSISRKNPASTSAADMFPAQVEFARALGVEVDMDTAVVTEIDDSHTTTTGELLKFQFDSKNWVPESGYPHMFQNGTDTYSTTAGASWTIKFVGTRIDVFGSINSGHGNYAVTLDGKNMPDMSADSTQGRLHKRLLGSYDNLDPKAEHTLTVSLKSGKAIQIDYAEVTHKPIAATGISALPSSLTLEGGSEAMIAASASPSAAVDPGAIFTFDDKLLSIDSTGSVTAKDVTERTETTVTVALAGDAGIKTEVPVTIVPKVEGFNAFVADPSILDIPAEAYEAAKTTFTDTWSDTAWLGDKRASKIGVATRDAAVKNVRIEAGDFTSESGDVISSENVEAKWLRTVDAREYRGVGGRVKAYPDIIYHANDGHDIPAESLALAWVTLSVPSDAVPGTYTGTLAVTADGVKAPVKLTYTLEVIGLTQPTTDEAGYEVQLWQHPFSVSGYYFANSTANAARGTGANADIKTFMSDEHKDLMRGSLKEYASIGGHDLVANIVEEAWDHQSYYGDTSMVTWIKRADGTWGFDYTLYDKWVAFAEECGVIDPAEGIGRIKCYSMVSWGGFRYLDEATGQMRALPSSVTQGSPEWRAMWEAFLKDFHAHSEKLGTWDITYISMDERGYSQLKPVVDLVWGVEESEGFDIKLSSALNVDADTKIISLSDDIDDISMNIMNINHEADFRKLADERAEKGLTTTIYNCTGGYPNNFMRNDPGDNYWTMWYALSTHTDGFLRWAWDNWVNDMFGNATYRYWEPGDGWFIYPLESADDLAKNPDGFYSTPRYEMFKQGVRDVCKALYLKEEFPEEAGRIDELIDSLERGDATMITGNTAAPASEEARLLTHAESARMYDGLMAVAREVAPVVEPEPVPVRSISGAALTAADGAVGTPAQALTLPADGGAVKASVSGLNLAGTDAVTAQVFADGQAVDADWATVTLVRAASGVAARAAVADDVATYAGTISFPENAADEAVTYEVRFSLNGEEAAAERVAVEVAAAEPDEEPGTEQPGGGETGGEQPGTNEPGTEQPGTGDNGSDGSNGSGGNNNGSDGSNGAGKGDPSASGKDAQGSKSGNSNDVKKGSLPKTGDVVAVLGLVTVAGAALAAGGTWIRRRK
ncbi:MAG: DUF4091 domain-containing protein [Coriobacteriaceae bacterium]|nr:DUF4091 domain-containing protein [Coriobacteriaceae bacterium]